MAGNAEEISSMGQQIFYGDWWAVKDLWSYSSADDPLFTVDFAGGDVRSSYTEGGRVKLVQAGTTKYFIIVKMEYNSGTTTTTLYLYGGSDYDLTSDDITEFYYAAGYAPPGFPTDEDLWTQEAIDTDDETQAAPTANIWYNSYPQLTIPIGKWKVSLDAQLKPVVSSAQAIDEFVTLSDTSSTETDVNWTAKVGAEDAKSLSMPVHLENLMTLAAKATYRPLMKTSCSGLDSINLEGASVRPTRIKAVCAYL